MAMRAEQLADSAVRMWPGLVVDYVGQLVCCGGDEVVFSMPARGLQFRADCIADCERYLGPAVQAERRTESRRQAMLF